MLPCEFFQPQGHPLLRQKQLKNLLPQLPQPPNPGDGAGSIVSATNIWNLAAEDCPSVISTSSRNNDRRTTEFSSNNLFIQRPLYKHYPWKPELLNWIDDVELHIRENFTLVRGELKTIKKVKYMPPKKIELR